MPTSKLSSTVENRHSHPITAWCITYSFFFDHVLEAICNRLSQDKNSSMPGKSGRKSLNSKEIV